MATRRAAMVLGGSGGIGLAIARVLAEEGYTLTIQGRRPESVEAAAAQLEGEVLARTADLRDEDAIAELVRAHRERFGRLDVLVNSAGTGTGEDLERITAKALDRQLSVNLRAAILVTRECAPLLREAGAGHGKALVVNVSSWAGKHGQPWLSVYSASKAALISFTEATQRELGDAGVQATALCPATVDTPMTAYAHDRIPPEEMLRPEDLAECVRLLLRVSPACRIPEIVLARAGDQSDKA